MAENINPPAFPQLQPMDYHPNVQGMGLLEWFAGQALSGILQMQTAESILYRMKVAQETKSNVPEILAIEAWTMADAMMKTQHMDRTGLGATKGENDETLSL